MLRSLERRAAIPWRDTETTAGTHRHEEETAPCRKYFQVCPSAPSYLSRHGRQSRRDMRTEYGKPESRVLSARRRVVVAYRARYTRQCTPLFPRCSLPTAKRIGPLRHRVLECFSPSSLSIRLVYIHAPHSREREARVDQKKKKRRRRKKKIPSEIFSIDTRRVSVTTLGRAVSIFSRAKIIALLLEEERTFIYLSFLRKVDSRSIHAVETRGRYTR